MPRLSALIVEDDPDTAHLIKHALERSGDLVARIATTGEAALTEAARETPDVIVLDLRLPRMSGLEVCRTLRSQTGTRSVSIVMLTARGSEDERVTGFESGADDYITKPFSPRELVARVRAVLRRGGGVDGALAAPTTYENPHLVVDFAAMSITAGGQRLDLTKREFELLRYLVHHKNRVVSRDRLLQDVWGYDSSVETRSVDVHVARLRTKLGAAGRQIETLIGLGYRFSE
jgi:two-component system, OmpR family, phosphate regulon response regulator PhoB